MPVENSQNFKNHVRFHPLFHFIFAPLAGILLVWALIGLVRVPGAASVRQLLLAIAVLLAGFLARTYALKVQDRVIRLEEKLRLSALLPVTLQAAANSLSERQLIALRFASDEELPELVERTRRDNLDGKAIKLAIRNWRPDYWRV